MTSMINDEDIKIIEAEGYHSGLYWDYRIKYYYKDEPFTMMYFGSGSGFMRKHLSIAKGFPELPKGDWSNGRKQFSHYELGRTIEDLKRFAQRLKASGEESMELSESNGDFYD